MNDTGKTLPQVEERDGFFWIQDLPYNYRFMRAVRYVKGRAWVSATKTWKFPSIPPVRRLLTGLGFQFAGESSTMSLAGEIEVPDPLPKIPQVVVHGLLRALRPFQAEGVSFLDFWNGRALLGDEMGLGKTIQVLAWWFYRRKFPAVVVCTATGKTTWRDECIQTLPGITVHLIQGKKLYPLPKADIYVVNYQILKPWVGAIRECRPVAVAFDEAHNMRNAGSQQTKACRALASRKTHIIAITGTPIVNKPKDLFTALHMLRPHVFPGWLDYGMKFCDGRHDGYQWNFNGSSHQRELNLILTRTVMIRRKKTEVAKDLPPKQRVVVTLTLSPSARKQYMAAETDFIGWCKSVGKHIPDQTVGLAKVEGLKQLVRDLKMEAVVEWVEDYLYNDEKLVLFATHTKTLDTLTKYFPTSVRLDGKVVGSTKRKQVAQKFQTDPSTRLFLGNLVAAGTTITLTTARTTCHVELGWLPGEHEQAEDRVHRIGQTADNVFAYYLITEDTIETKLWKLLGLKHDIIQSVVDGIHKQDARGGLLSRVIHEYSSNVRL